MLIKVAQEWEMPEREATPESVYLNRRQWLASMGLLASPSLLAGAGPYPAKRNPEFTLDRPITPESAATGYNNFYEFGTDKEAVQNRVGKFNINPWKVEVTGLVNKPQTFAVDDLVSRMPLEERLYRHRCVERWAMAVPWTGFPFSELVKLVEPKPGAKFVYLHSVNRPKEMPGVYEQPWYHWPYREALRLDEMMNPLTLVVTGLYGKPLPKQNGAPIRLVVPWKYGFKSPKSIVKIEFVTQQPNTFWNKLAPGEYGFYSNVDPTKPHPRWSQAEDFLIPKMERRPTLPYNGYGKYVAQMYRGDEV